MMSARERSFARFHWSGICLLATIGLCVMGSTVRAADPPPVELALKFKPSQQDVDYDTPDQKSIPQCKVNVIREGKGSGWVVLGPNGLALRRFMDSNGDNIVDQWGYFKNGLEVYRDIDTNANNKVDQCRWLNIGGLRWGIDQNEDGKIDVWKMISAEEVSRVAVRALITQDASLLTPLLVTKEDLKSLKIDDTLSAKILDAVSEPSAKLKKIVAASKMIGPKTAWLRFDGAAPSVIPADQLGVPNDLFVYENVMAIVDTGAEPGLVQIGELVKIGDIWKMTSLPQPLEGKSMVVAQSGSLMEPALVSGTVSTDGNQPQVPAALQKDVEELQELDKRAPAPTAGKSVIADYTDKRLALLKRIEAKAEGDTEQWQRQMVDTITAAVQVGAYPKGIDRLQAMLGELQKKSSKSKLTTYVQYRVMVAEYSEQMQAASNEERQKIQEGWLKTLEAWVTANPEAEDAPNAEQQLAIALEFNGKVDKAKEWYQRIVTDHEKSPEAVRATGALKRLSLVGQPLVLSGTGLKGEAVDIKQYRNRIVLVIFWSTWCKPCTEDLPEIKDLYDRYKSKGFDVLGVNLDNNPADVGPYIAQFKVPWNHIQDPGGLEGPIAKQYGIISLPTMFILTTNGLVYKNSSSVAELKEALSEAFEKKADSAAADKEKKTK